MPTSKLTLSIDKATIEQGKLLARYRGLSLSKLIEQFLQKEITELPPKDYIAVTPDAEVLAIVSDYKPTESYADDYDRYKEEYYEHIYNRGRQSEEE